MVDAATSVWSSEDRNYRRERGDDNKFAARMTSASGRTFLMKHASLDTHPPNMDTGPLRKGPRRLL